MRRLLLPCSFLLVAAVSAGCTDAPEPIERSEDSSASPSETPSGTPDDSAGTGEGPVAGSGASLSPEDRATWCGVVTADQLSALTGYEVTEVRGEERGLRSCSAELPDLELQITWGSEPTGKTFEKYAAGWERPAGVYDVSEVELPGGQPAVVATQAVPQAGHAGTVLDGQVVQVLVAEVVPDDATTVDDLGDVAETDPRGLRGLRGEGTHGTGNRDRR